MGVASGGDKSPAHRKETTGGAWGPSATARPRSGPGSGGPTYSSITSINTSVRDNKNILEVRLEKQPGASFNLTMLEAENLCKRLNIDSSHLLGVSACPEGRPVVFITLHPSTDITKFMYKNESYIVKEGVRTTTIRQEGKKDKVVKITGLHPNTRDQAVVKYLCAHGVLSTKERIIHHVFPGEPGSSLLAGKLNGNRSYVMDELKVPLGSYHIIDGEKVSIRYPGQEWTCARCHQLKSICPGAALARDCTAERVLLSTHMAEHWQKVGYKPETDTMNEVDGVDLEIQVGGNAQKTISVPESTLAGKYSSVIVKGFRVETEFAAIKEVLIENGLPADHAEENFTRNSKTGSLTVISLKSEECIALNKMNRKRFLNRQIFITSVVGDSPIKSPPARSSLLDPVPAPVIDLSKSSSLNIGLVDRETGAISKIPPANLTLGEPRPVRNSTSSDQLSGFVFGLVSPGVQDKIEHIEELKRKSEGSPEGDLLSRKDKKILRKEEKSLKKKEKKQELKANQNLVEDKNI